MCKSDVELEYHLEEVFKATNDQLDWHNPEGRSYPHDLSKLLPLILDVRGRQIIPYDHFINNDLEYLKGGSLSRKYTTSVTKTKAADYGHVKWIEDKIPRSTWSKGKLMNLNMDERFVLNVALRMYTRRIVIQERVEDLQLAVESYQKKINLTKPNTYRSDISKKTPYTTYHDIQGIIYQDDMDRNRLMRTDELHKFSDGTLNYVRTSLNDIATGIQMEYLPKKKKILTSAGNPVKEILLKLNLPDHRKLKDGGEGVIFLSSFSLCSVTNISSPILTVLGIPVISEYFHANISALSLSSVTNFCLNCVGSCLPILTACLGASPMVIRRIVSPKGLTCSLKNPESDAEGSQVVKDLRSENAQVSEELSMLREVSDSAEDSQKKLSEELDGLRPSVEEVKRLDVEDYNPDAKNIFDEAGEAFYKLEFPYISLLVEKVDQSLKLLAVVDPPTI
ncbi:hypothetical protein Tco_1092993 [Tanacetum coccineum]|uniref:Uncharacterized protein n=1 Tax=Tanacetum coccineum TaxID=301880 RepID=A0ABQ5IBI3_9ASTR